MSPILRQTTTLLFLLFPTAHAGFTRTAKSGADGEILRGANNASRRPRLARVIVTSSSSTSAAASPLFRSQDVITSTSRAHKNEEPRRGRTDFSQTYQIRVSSASGKMLRFRKRLQSMLGFTFNTAATAVFAAQLIGQGILIPSSMLSSPPMSTATSDIPVSPTTIMRVAPAGATSVVLEANTESRLAMSTLAGTSAAVAGTLLGRGYLNHRRRRREAKSVKSGEEESAFDQFLTEKEQLVNAAAPAPTSTFSSEDNVHITHAQEATENKNKMTLADKLIQDGEASRRDYERMRLLLEKRLEIDTKEKERAQHSSEPDEVAPVTALKLTQDRDNTKNDYLKMKSLLEARLRVEAAEKENIKKRRENFQRLLLIAKLRQDRIDELRREEQFQMKKETREMEANAKAQARQRPSTITPELMSTIKIMQGDKQDASPSEVKNDLMESERKERLNAVLASAAALLVSISASSKAGPEV